MKQQSLLKPQQIPKHLLTHDKKANNLISNKFYRSKIRTQRNKINALLHNFQPGYIQAQQGQQTKRITQNQIKDLVNIQTASNIFDLQLNMGKYVCEYSLNGSSLLLGSSLGHLAIINWRDKIPILQINLKQNITHCKFLHSNLMFGLTQTTGTYIYDNKGIQLHHLQKSLGLQYLPYHFLLVTYDQHKLKYYDTTTGYIIADHIAKNPYTVMRQNPSNAIIALGSAKGTVQWWIPGMGTPALKMFVGAGISDLGFYKGYMYTAAQDIKIWDSRMLKQLYTYPLDRKCTSIQLSQSGLLAINYGYKLITYKDTYLTTPAHPYLTYKPSTTITNCKFIPFQDIMGIARNNGFSSIAIPGSGIPYYDTYQINPFQSKKQLRQSLVHKLLDKLPPQTITIDPTILGSIDKTSREVLQKQQKQQQQLRRQQQKMKKSLKNKTRGKNNLKSKLIRKNIQMQQKRKQQITKVINTKLWAKWAEKKKKSKQMQLLNQISEKGLSVAELTIKSKNNKNSS